MDLQDGQDGEPVCHPGRKRGEDLEKQKAALSWCGGGGTTDVRL